MNIRINWWALGEVVVITIRALTVVAVVGGVSWLLVTLIGTF